MNTAQSKIIQIKNPKDFDLSLLEKGQIHRLNIHIQKSPLGISWKIPAIVAIGPQKGPTLGISAAIHGNELNGLHTILKLFEQIDPQKLSGILLAIPVMNIPGFLLRQRESSDNKDLNRIMPGKAKGSASEMYAYQYAHTIVNKLNYLIDLHTANTGRINTLYVRTDLRKKNCRHLALHLHPQVILHKSDEEGTLRWYANSQKIPCITVEIGAPSMFEHQLTQMGVAGIFNILKSLSMLPERPDDLDRDKIIVCHKSGWIYSYVGGVVDIYPQINDHVKKGEIVGKVYDIFGRTISLIKSKRSGIGIGKNTNPVCESGTRLLHIGELVHEKRLLTLKSRKISSKPTPKA